MEEKCLSEWGRDHLEFASYFLTRRHGGAEKHAEDTSSDWLRPLGRRAGESNLTARSQRRSYSFAARLTPGWKAEDPGCSLRSQERGVYGSSFNGHRDILPV